MARIFPAASTASSACDDLVAAVIIAGKGVGARRHPFHRAAAAARGPQHQRVFRIGVGLHAKAAADVRRDDAEFRFRQTKHVTGELGAHRVRRLRAGVERVAVFGAIVIADRRARLHGVRREAVVLEPQRHEMRGLRKRGLGRLLVADASVNDTLPGHSSQTSGAPGLTASSICATAGSGS